VLPIEDLFETVPVKPVFDGKHEVKDVSKLDLYMFIGVAGDVAYTKINKIFRHKYKGKLVRVLARGGIVDTSPNHSIYIRKGENINSTTKLADARLLKPGDRILIPRLSRLGMKRDYNNSFIGSLDLAWFYGFFTADGYAFARKRGSKAWIYNTDKALLERAKQIYEENFHRPASILINKKDGSYMLQMTGKWVAKFFRENFYTTQGQKKVPSFVFNASREVRKAFLEGFYAGDGRKNPKGMGQSFDTSSQTLAQGIILLDYSVYGRPFRISDDEDYPSTLSVTFNIPEAEGGRPYRRLPRDEVRKVYEIPYEGWMYDIETQNPHMFTTGVGPIKVHNSIYEFEYPHFLEITEEDPEELEFYNNTDLTVIQDFSIWLFECHMKHLPLVRRYLKGLFNLFYWFGGVEPMEVGKLLKAKKKEDG